MSKRRYLSVRIVIGILGILLLTPPGVCASDVDRLLDLLVKKHVVTEQEAADLRTQIQADHSAPSSPPSAEEEKKDQVRAQTSQPEPAPPAQGTNHSSQKIETPVLGSIPIKLSGYIQARWTDSAGTTNPFEVRRARFTLAGDVGHHAGYRVQVDLADTPTLLDARFDWQPSPYAHFTAGQFKIPFSQESLASPRDLLAVSRSAVVNNLAPGRDIVSDGRDIGLMVEGGLLQHESRQLVSYSLGVFNGAGINRTDDNRRKDVAMRLAVSPFKGLTFAGDYYIGASGSNLLSKDRADLELAYIHGRTTLMGEYLWGHIGTVRKDGWYALAAYRFVPRLEGLFRFDTYDPNLNLAKNRTSTYLGGLNWYVSPWIKVQADYGLVDNQARTSLSNLVQTQLQVQF